VGVQLIALILAVVLVLAGYSAVARQYVKSQAIQFMDVMLSVREYTSRKVNPILAPINAVSDEAFLPAAVPSYSATKVFEYLKLNHAYEDFQYREASLNPTSPADLADEEEALLIRRFIDDPSLKELSGSLKTSSDHHQYFVAKPIRLSKESCLVCHSTPERAPRSQLRVYGKKGGFGWKVGDGWCSDCDVAARCRPPSTQPVRFAFGCSDRRVVSDRDFVSQQGFLKSDP